MPNPNEDHTLDIGLGFGDDDGNFSFDIGEEMPVADYTALINKPSIESVVLEGDRPIKTWVDEITPQDIDKLLFG